MRKLAVSSVLVLLIVLGCSLGARERWKAFFFEVPEASPEGATAEESSVATRPAPQPAMFQRPPPRFASLHEPFVRNDCRSCHDATQRMQVYDDLTDSCRKCHQAYFTEEIAHAPVAMGQCVLCHDMHRSHLPHLLTAPVAEGCGQCHGEIEDLSTPVHAVAGVENCTTCHDPHFGSGMYLRPGYVPTAPDAP